MFEPQPFDREKHVYRCDEFSELLKDAVRFFHGSPICEFPLKESFVGAGVYALYYIGKTGIYDRFGKVINREDYCLPIYVGKAEPTGWRQSFGCSLRDQFVFLKTLIEKSRGLRLSDFRARVLDERVCPVYGDLYACLCRKYRPVWNRLIFRNGTSTAEKRWRLFHPQGTLSEENRSAREIIRKYLESA